MSSPCRTSRTVGRGTPIAPTGWAVELDADESSHLDVDFGFRRVVVLDEGRVIAEGTHADLLAHNSRYRGILAAEEVSA